MRVRGERECVDCGTQWSYYETGSVACPSCGSLRSAGVGERERHTATPVELDLTPVRELAGEERWEEACEAATERCGEYVRRRGFIHGGDLLAFDDTYLAAGELRGAAREFGRGLRASDAEEIYLLALLRGADSGERPAVETVPESMAASRALAYAKAIEEYRREVSTYLSDHPESAAAGMLGSVAEHVKRVQALDGDVDLTTVEALVCTTKDVGQAIREGDDRGEGKSENGPLATARDRLDRLSRL